MKKCFVMIPIFVDVDESGEIVNIDYPNEKEITSLVAESSDTFAADDEEDDEPGGIVDPQREVTTIEYENGDCECCCCK